MHGHRNFALGQAGANFSEPLYNKSSGKSCHEVITISNESTIPRSFLTGKMAYYVLSSILAMGILILVAIPLASSVLYYDYKQQLAQRKSKDDLCKTKCSYGAECIIDEYTSQPFCRCPLSCNDDYVPVCGSDGTINYTFRNMCFLKYEACQNRAEITVVANRPCDASQCESVTCHRYQKCQVDEKGKAQCVCAAGNCHTSPGPKVCGSNNKLYGSLCELQRHACFYNLDIVPTNLESCLNAGDTLDSEEGDQSGHTGHQLKADTGIMCGIQVCRPYEECKTVLSEDSPQPVQVCQCAIECEPSQEDGPVCGVLGTEHAKTYANLCQLRRDACQRQLGEVKVLHPGLCGHCRQRCEHYATCKPNDQGIPECLCPQVCIRTDHFAAVCGDNGVTYESECELAVASCRLQQRINVRFNGSCDRCQNVHCPFGATCVNGECLCPEKCENNGATATEHLCANDGTTYKNECEMKRAACKNQKELNALFYGACEETSEKFLDDTAALLANDYEANASSLLEDSARISQCHHSRQNCDQSRAEYGQVYICEDSLFGSRCEMEEFKCRNANNKVKCSKYCHCNQYGVKAHSLRPCNPRTSQCDCKEGITGKKCDKCASKFWDFQHLLENPLTNGCRACKCNRHGSVSEDCDKVTGRCRCRLGVKGPKCDQCPPLRRLTSRGCLPDASHSCHLLKCQFGAVCRQNGSLVECSCQFNCLTQSQPEATPVCSDDGAKHLSMCHFQEHMCRFQRKIHVVDCAN